MNLASDYFVQKTYQALLIGKIILAFGELDAGLYAKISHAQSERSRRYRAAVDNDWAALMHHPEPERESIDHRFEHRLKLLRRVSRQLAGDANEYLLRLDGLLNKVRELHRIRSHLAHEALHSKGTAVWPIAVFSAREMERYAEARENTRDLNELWAKHMNIAYGREDLEQALVEIERVKGELAETCLDLMVFTRPAGAPGS